MGTENKKIELMSPAGDFSTLKTAIDAGADAVYFGVNDFSMRTGKRNFVLSDIEKINEVCNSSSRKVKKYLTLNTIVYDKEIKRLEEIIANTKEHIDAVICSDLAVMELCNKYQLPFIVSTQCSISNRKAAEFYRDLGAKRVVLARELSLEQIAEIAKIENLEVEVFAHGAMCVAVSGRCFMSQFLFNKSANRGECLHPCRRGYKVTEKELGYELDLYHNTVMSAKDLCTLPFIEELKKANIDALKIEGRNRDERYISTVTKAYRQAIDKTLTAPELIDLMEELQKVFHRDFSSGFYLGKPTPQDFATLENSAATTYRDYVGKVTHFYPRLSVALISLNKEIKKGEEIIFVHKNDSLKSVKITQMEVDYKKREKAEKEEEVAVKTNEVVKKGAAVYKIVEK